MEGKKSGMRIVKCKKNQRKLYIHIVHKRVCACIRALACTCVCNLCTGAHLNSNVLLCVHE